MPAVIHSGTQEAHSLSEEDTRCPGCGVRGHRTLDNMGTEQVLITQGICPVRAGDGGAGKTQAGLGCLEPGRVYSVYRGGTWKLTTH